MEAEVEAPVEAPVEATPSTSTFRVAILTE